MDDDASVVRRVLAGDVDAFRVLVDRYNDRLFQFCMARLGDSSDAEDAVQDVLVRAFRSLRSFDPASPKVQRHKAARGHILPVAVAPLPHKTRLQSPGQPPSGQHSLKPKPCHDLLWQPMLLEICGSTEGGS